MRTTEKTSLRRCSTCRRWYRSHPSAQGRQKTCSAECRRQRLRRLAKQRREHDLESYRERERLRQQKCRQLRTERSLVASKEPSASTVSRSGLSWQTAVLQGEILRIVDRHLERSRATLRAEVVSVLGEIAPILDRA